MSPQIDTRRIFARLPLAVILLSGAFLRFYDLGAFPLTWDEILVPLVARHSLAYIFSFCSVQEMHPPLFYWITKIPLLVSSHDVALRFLPAFAGTISIYLVYRIAREFFDEETGLFAAAFLSINILHFLLSRAARPYSLQTALFLAAFWLIARLVKKGQWNDLLLLCFVNILLFWLHYFAYYMVAAQGVVLAFGLFRKPAFVTPGQFVVFCCFTLLTAIPIYVWFVVPSLAYQVSGAHFPRQGVLLRILDSLRGASIFALPKVGWAGLMYLGPLAGWMICLWRKPKFAALCLAIAGLPFAIVFAMAPGYPLQLWHVVWLTPILSLFAAVLVSRLPDALSAALPTARAGRFSMRRSLRVLAPLVAVGGSFFIFIQRHDLDLEIFTPRYDLRAAAGRLAPLLSSDALIADAASPGFFNTQSWFLDQSSKNPLITQRLEPGTAPIILHFLVGNVSAHDPTLDSAAYLRAAMGGQGTIAPALAAAVHTFQLDRRATVIDALPLTFAFSANPGAFYSRVYRLRNVRSVPGYTIPGFPLLDRFRDLEGGIAATQNNQPGFFEFVLENRLATDKPLRLSVDLGFVNIGSGNRMRLLARFDDEPSLALAQRTGPDPDRSLSVSLSRNTPFKRLAFTVEMYCKDETALPFGDNLRTLVFQRLSVNIAETGAAAPLHGAAPLAP